MPLTKCNVDGKSGWKWGDKGHCYPGASGKKKAIRQGYAEGPDKFKEEMGKANTYDGETLILAKRVMNEYDRSEAKIVRADNGGWKILGVGDYQFETIEGAIDFQYSGGDTTGIPGITKTDRKGERSKENFYAMIRDEMAGASEAEFLEELDKTYAYVTKKERDQTDEKDFADPKNKKYPISTKDHLKSAIKLYGRSKDTSPDEVKRNIIKIAKRKGWSAELPDDWK